MLRPAAAQLSSLKIIEFNRTENVSYNRSGAELGVSMLKRYLDYHFRKDSNIPFDSKRLWEFRYRLQYEEPSVKAVQQDPFMVKWIDEKIDEQ